jgi:hypothetical protein
VADRAAAELYAAHEKAEKDYDRLRNRVTNKVYRERYGPDQKTWRRRFLEDSEKGNNTVAEAIREATAAASRHAKETLEAWHTAHEKAYEEVYPTFYAEALAQLIEEDKQYDD